MLANFITHKFWKMSLGMLANFITHKKREGLAELDASSELCPQSLARVHLPRDLREG